MSLRALATRWYQEVWNERNLDSLRELMSPDAVGHTEGGDMHGPDDFVELFHKPFLAAFPDIKVTVEDVLAMDSDAVVRWSASGHHMGEAFGIGATRKRVTMSGMSWLKFKDGLIVEGWDHWNFSGLINALTDGSCTATIRAEEIA